MLSRVITLAVFAVRGWIEGVAPPRERREYEIDCAEHGRTYLRDSRRTECCASLQWVPSGKVVSRKVRPYVLSDMPVGRP